MIRAMALMALLMRQDAAAPVTVSAAVSLTECLDAIGRAYQDSGGGAVRFNYAGSHVLARQIASGAPVDVFISADERQMDVAARAGAIDATTRVDLLGNHLAVVTRADRSGLGDARGLLHASIRRIAIGDPEAVPAGVYARQYLQAAGLWTAIAGKLVPVASVRAALAAVENGSADAAITYETDAVAAKGRAPAVVITGAAAPRIVYPAAIVSSSRHRAAAARFVSFLRGPEATAIFRKYKFVPLAAR
jgi:molybdate transport system substrate-binding protein